MGGDSVPILRDASLRDAPQDEAVLRSTTGWCITSL